MIEGRIRISAPVYVRGGIKMVRIKEMPYHEKYAKLLDNIKFDDAFITPFIRQHLGDQAAADLQRIWQQGTKAIPEDAS